jgi:hypothetical protein
MHIFTTRRKQYMCLDCPSNCEGRGGGGGWRTAGINRNIKVWYHELIFSGENSTETLMCNHPYFADTISREQFRRRRIRPLTGHKWQNSVCKSIAHWSSRLTNSSRMRFCVRRFLGLENPGNFSRDSGIFPRNSGIWRFFSADFFEIFFRNIDLFGRILESLIVR